MERREIATSTETHVLVFRSPAEGHINPLLHFPKLLASKGLKVTLAATHKYMQPQDSSIQIEHISSCFEEDGQDTDNAIFDHLGMAVVRGLPELIEKQKSLGCPVKLIVYYSFMPHSPPARPIWSCTLRSILVLFVPFTNMSIKGPRYILILVKGLRYRCLYREPRICLHSSMKRVHIRLVVNQLSDYGKAGWRLCNPFDKIKGESAEKPNKSTDVGPAVKAEAGAG
ncbi:hypothetical protein RJ639_015018 [Escallonia herrerae]|uniref:Uncharacterized protein n=1 Tax=Escallonia herrerae TaxID=1293975 RepID=A0AA89AME3_9ASTE|nr:hypothetical protein RJ639_015018 [Escallonia herrerae]